MIGTIALTFVRQRLVSPMRLILTIFFFGFGVVGVLFSGSLGMLAKGEQGVFGLVMAAGLIGQEVSSGVLTLTLARPLRRSDYVLGRWLGASALATACVVLQVAVATGVAILRHGEPTLALVAVKLAEGALAVTGASAVLLLFSSLVPGLGDLGLLALGLLSSSAMTVIGMHQNLPWLSRGGDELHRFLDASLDLSPLLGQGSLSWFEIASYLSTLAICVIAAIAAVNRKELSYASG